MAMVVTVGIRKKKTDRDLKHLLCLCGSRCKFHAWKKNNEAKLPNSFQLPPFLLGLLREIRVDGLSSKELLFENV